LYLALAAEGGRRDQAIELVLEAVADREGHPTRRSCA
jgi:hypothetical protein